MRNVFNRFVCVAFVLNAQNVFAQGIEIIVLRNSAHAPNIIFPHVEDHSAPADIEKYVATTRAEEGLKELVPSGFKINIAQAGDIKPLSQFPQTKPRILVFANEYNDLSARPGGNRIAQIVDNLTAKGAEVFILPVASDIHLSQDHAASWRTLVSKSFHGVLAIGGTDFDPKFYDEENKYARDPNPIRDAAELRMLAQNYREGRTAIFGICRGHQACAIARNKDQEGTSHWNHLIQDIPKQTNAQLDHTNAWHRVRISSGTILAKILGRSEINVYSYHHQAAKNPIAKNFLIAAESIDPGQSIIEAAEWKDAFGFSVQWHPEIGGSLDGERLLQGMVELSIVVKEAENEEFFAAGGCNELRRRFLLP